jgi:hypothetical protein
MRSVTAVSDRGTPLDAFLDHGYSRPTTFSSAQETHEVAPVANGVGSGRELDAR